MTKVHLISVVVVPTSHSPYFVTTYDRTYTTVFGGEFRFTSKPLIKPLVTLWCTLPTLPLTITILSKRKPVMLISSIATAENICRTSFENTMECAHQKAWTLQLILHVYFVYR